MEEVKMLRFQFAPLFLAILLLPSSGHAGLITVNNIGNPVVIGFDDFDAFYIFSPGPHQVGNPVGLNVVLTSTQLSTVIGYGGYGLDGNGNWERGANSVVGGHVGLNSDTGSFLFTFNGFTVSAVGGFINYAVTGYPDVTIEALDSGLNVLESYNINLLAPISTPGGQEEGAFRGIARPTADIAAFRVSNGFVVLDNLTLGDATGTVIPEPGTWALSFTALAVLGLLRRRRAVLAGPTGINSPRK
jgi:hypothetical protein